MPIVKLSQAMRKLNPGDQLTVDANDAAFHPDLLAWAKQLGHHIDDYQPGETQRAIVTKGGSVG